MYNSWIKSNHWVAIAKEEGFVWKTHLFFGNKKIFSRTISVVMEIIFTMMLMLDFMHLIQP